MSRGSKFMSSKSVTVLALALAVSFMAGCSVHLQAPIKEVAYDFSDADFYDRAYAPSPTYENAYVEVEAPVVAERDVTTSSEEFVAVRKASGALVLMPAPASDFDSVVVVRAPVR